jgi:hypothetical protein
MAAPINRFRTITKKGISTSYTVLYTGPENNTAIVLMTQVSNTTTSPPDPRSFSMKLVDAAGNERATLIENYEIPANDAANILTGKLVIEERERLEVKASAGNVDVTISVLESRNA